MTALADAGDDDAAAMGADHLDDFGEGRRERTGEGGGKGVEAGALASERPERRGHRLACQIHACHVHARVIRNRHRLLHCYSLAGF